MGENNLQSPFMDRIKTNYYATDVEVPEIRLIVSDSLEERQRIEERISRFSALIDDLHLQLEKLDEHIHNHRALISGIRKLPVEVMQTIFRWCLPSRNCAMSSGEPPLSLGRVCSTWRQISFSTPQLWSSLHISPPYDHGPDKNGLLVRYGEAIEAWLSRSASLPISISFVEDQYPPDPDSPVSTDARYLLDVILRFSHRWKHFNSRILQEYRVAFIRLTENDVPVLETVQLELVNAPPGSAFPFLSFLHSPSIRKLFLWDYLSQALSTLHVRWEVLTSLYFIQSLYSYNSSRWTLNDILNILNKCPRLAILVCEVSQDEAGIVSTHTISLPHLQELRVKLTTWQITEEQLRRFFASLDLPQLRHIELTEASYIRRPPFLPLLCPQNRIDTMAFDVTASTVHDLSECLHMAPSLKRIYLNSSFMSEEDPPEALPSLSATFISRLHPASPTTETTLCPLLEEVELLFPPSTNVTDDDILRFILSRTTLAPEGVVRLRRASFTFRRYLQRDIYPDLAPVLEMGFKLHLKYDEPLSASSVMPIFTPLRYIHISDHLHDDAWQPQGFRAHRDGRSLPNRYSLT
ncbi:hypothetical protein FPV67DRAFT_214511 [Lyophyllum atratum]|nr:hypothetical protein FPV67DRAFT_214511 [Lyophyllum atratum]